MWNNILLCFMCADYQSEIWYDVYFTDNNLRAYFSAILMYETFYISHTKILMKIFYIKYAIFHVSHIVIWE